jgi:hypothetical protein
MGDRVSWDSRYVDDIEESQQGVTYAEWEAQNAANLQLPEWMQRILRVPGGALCLLLILFPVTLVRPPSS